MNELRPDEEFVIRSLAKMLGGKWWAGENPPDAYLKLGDKIVAVEISTLTQPVLNGTEFGKERRSGDVGALRFCEELDNEVKSQIPKGICVILILYAPINKFRRFKKLLSEKIIEYSSRKIECEFEGEILDNKYNIQIVSGERPSGKKIVGIISNSRSSADILANAVYALNDRLFVKSRIMTLIKHDGERWLVLLNDYWLSDEETYKRAMSLINIEHPFERLYIVFDSKKIICQWAHESLPKMGVKSLPL